MDILENAIKEDLVFIDFEADNKEDLLLKLAKILEEKGYVKESYLDGVLTREQQYPTGLLLENYNIAIPHTDSKHVNESAIIIAKLKRPVMFKYMADPTVVVNAQLVMMLAIKDSKSQVPVLSELMNRFSDNALVEDLKEETNKKEFIKKLIKGEK